jgi:hypothetical protein
MGGIQIMRKYILILIAIILLVAGEGWATDYYASPTGSGTTCSNSSPCNVSYAVNTKSSAGDTVLLKDGTYTGTNSMIAPTKSGINDSTRITIKALNDGKAIVDGQGSWVPCLLNELSYIDLEGIVCKNSSSNVVNIYSSSYINLRRVSAYDAKDNGNTFVFYVAYSDQILLEDVAASNTGRYMYNIYESDYVTVRRCYGRWTDYVANPTSMPKGIMQIYGSNYNVVENCIGVIAVSPPNEGGGLAVWANTYNMSASHNKIYGTVMIGAFAGASFSTSAAANANNTNDTTDNEFYNIVAIDNTTLGISNFHHRAGSVIVKNVTLVNSGYAGFNSDRQAGYPYPPYNMSSTVKNSVFLSHRVGFNVKTSEITETNKYNNYYNNTSNYSGFVSKGIGEITTQPNYDTTTYGKGAYLIAPTALKGLGENGTNMGAEVLYRYQNGTLTSTPLWPWPMEARICDETGYSVTYEKGCSKGGGFWKTLNDVYSGSLYSGSPPNPPLVIE